MRRRLLKRRSALLLSSLVIIIDQIFKIWAKRQLDQGISTNFIPNLIKLRLVQNRGAAFSLFSEHTLLLGLLSLAISIALLILLWRNARMPIWKGIAIALLLGGSIGNGLDRLRLGYVIDFIELVPIDFPIFNIADISINIAVISFVIDNLTKRNAQNPS